jgi:prepilin-type processing-associated H-X9-DG protein
LAAILFPVFAQAREAARATTCTSNMRQLGMGLHMYVDDYDETLPCVWEGLVKNSGTGGWMFYSNFDKPTVFDPTLGSLYPYVKNAKVYECPSDPAHMGNSYAYNALVTRFAPVVYGFHAGLPLAALTAPAATFLFVEEASPDSPFRSTNDGYFDPRNDRVTLRHHNGTSAVFCDGHARFVQGDAVRYKNPGGDLRFEP